MADGSPAPAGTPTKTYTAEEVQRLVAASHSTRDKQINELKRKQTELESQIELLGLPETDRPQAKARADARRATEEGAETVARAAKVEAAAILAEKYAKYGVKYSELVELEPLAMQERCLEVVETHYGEARGGPQPAPRDSGSGIITGPAEVNGIEAVREGLKAVSEGGGTMRIF